jgi:hypothetical protein
LIIPANKGIKEIINSPPNIETSKNSSFSKFANLKEIYMAVGALVLGIIATALNITCFWLPFFGQIISIIVGVIGTILGAMGIKKEPEKASQAKAGLILSIVGLVLGVILCAGWIILTVFAATAGTGTPDFWKNFR